MNDWVIRKEVEEMSLLKFYFLEKVTRKEVNAVFHCAFFLGLLCNLASLLI